MRLIRCRTPSGWSLRRHRGHSARILWEMLRQLTSCDQQLALCSWRSNSARLRRRSGQASAAITTPVTRSHRQPLTEITTLAAPPDFLPRLRRCLQMEIATGNDSASLQTAASRCSSWLNPANHSVVRLGLVRADPYRVRRQPVALLPPANNYWAAFTVPGYSSRTRSCGHQNSRTNQRGNAEQ